jgi:hypothetical protein
VTGDFSRRAQFHGVSYVRNYNKPVSGYVPVAGPCDVYCDSADFKIAGKFSVE